MEWSNAFRFSNLYQCMISWALLLKAKLKWIRNVLILKITIKALKHSFFKRFTKIGRSDIGSCLEPFLKTAVACVNLSLLGKMPQRRESLIMDDRNGGIGVLRIFSNGAGIQYGPMDLLLSTWDMYESTPTEVTRERNMESGKLPFIKEVGHGFSGTFACKLNTGNKTLNLLNKCSLLLLGHLCNNISNITYEAPYL